MARMNVMRTSVLLGAVCCASLSACAVPARSTCTAGRFDAVDVGGAGTPTAALQAFLHTLDGAGMPGSGWTQTQQTAGTVTFRNGSDQVIAVLVPDGWEVGPYTTCAA